MPTCRPGGYKWFILMEKLKKQERYRIERQRIIDEIELLKKKMKDRVDVGLGNYGTLPL